MPAEVRAWLERVLIDRTHPGYVALSRMLRERGCEISHAALHRYDQKLQRVMERIRASAEAARMIAQAAPDEADEHSAAVLRMVQSSLFGALTDIAGAAEEADPERRVRVLASAARAIAEASRASIGQKRWAEEVRERLDAVEQSAKQAGRRLDPETLKAVREALYGG